MSAKKKEAAPSDALRKAAKVKRGPLQPERARGVHRAQADTLRANLRKVEDREDVLYLGPSAVSGFEFILRENARHGAILEGWLREWSPPCRWNPSPPKPRGAERPPEGRVEKIKGIGVKKGEGGKRGLLRMDVERILWRISEEDGVRWDKLPNDKALHDRIRLVLSWMRADPADLTDAKIKATVRNIKGAGLPHAEREAAFARTVEAMDTALVKGLGWERDPPLEDSTDPAAASPSKKGRKKGSG